MLNRMNITAQKVAMGDELAKVKNVIKGRYSFAVQGGAIGSVNLLKDLGDKLSYVVLPLGALVTGSWVDHSTACTSGGAATVALSTGQAANDVLAATAVASMTGLVEGVSTGTAANMKKMTAARTATATIAAAALTAGVFNVFLEYVLSN